MLIFANDLVFIAHSCLACSVMILIVHSQDQFPEAVQLRWFSQVYDALAFLYSISLCQIKFIALDLALNKQL